MTSIQAIGFDLGETLFFYRGTPLNWTGRYPEALGKVARALNFAPSAEHLAVAHELLRQHNTRVFPRTHEVCAEDIFSRVLDNWGINTPKNVSLAVAAFFSCFQQDLCSYPDASSVLHQLRQSDIPVGVLTDVPYGMPARFVHSDLTQVGLAGSFDVLLTSVDVGCRKPAASGYIVLAERLGVHPRKLLYVGNEQKDIQGARAAGAFSVLIDREGLHSEFGQDYTIHSLSDLSALLKNL